MREATLFDRVLAEIDRGLRVSLAEPVAAQRQPEMAEDGEMDDREKQHAAGLMRINHSGEVCAQALYYGQASTAKNGSTRDHLLHAAEEEGEHLYWCHQRLKELKSGPSVFNPLWYGLSFGLGAVTGLMGDRWSLGFVTETETQVEAHLNDHMERLPPGDQRSRGIVSQMAEDEARHGLEAQQAGGRELPGPVKRAMAGMADVMKWFSYRI